MLITEKFVLLNFPKTGSSFIRSVVKKMYKNRTGFSYIKHKIKRDCLFELILPIKRSQSAIETARKNYHGSYDQIPNKYHGLPVLSAIRNPYDRLVSQYEFKKLNSHKISSMSFNDYFNYNLEYRTKDVLMDKKLKVSLGPQSINFIKFFCPNWSHILDNIDEDYINNQRLVKELPKNLTLLRTESLNESLLNKLLELGYSKKETSFILQENKVNISRDQSKADWMQYYSQKMLDEITFQERLLFNLFPEYRMNAR